jgi:hypothetical protein
MLAAKPIIQLLAHEGVVAQVRIGAADPIDLASLAGAERLARVDAPCPLQEPLPREHLVSPGKARGESVGGVEDGVGVGNLDVAPQFGRDPARTSRCMVNADVCQEQRQAPLKPYTMPCHRLGGRPRACALRSDTAYQRDTRYNRQGRQMTSPLQRVQGPRRLPRAI